MIQSPTTLKKEADSDQTVALILTLLLTTMIIVGVGGVLFYLHLNNLNKIEVKEYTKSSAITLAQRFDTQLTRVESDALMLAKSLDLSQISAHSPDEIAHIAATALANQCKRLHGSLCMIIDSTGKVITHVYGQTEPHPQKIQPTPPQHDWNQQSIDILQTDDKLGSIIYATKPINPSLGQRAGAVAIIYPTSAILQYPSDQTGFAFISDAEGKIDISSQPSWLGEKVLLLPKASNQSSETNPAHTYQYHIQQIENDIAIDSEGNSYLFYHTKLNKLSGWELNYLHPINAPVPSLLPQQGYLGLAIVSLMLIFCLIIFYLIGKIRKAAIQRREVLLALKVNQERFKLLVNIANEAIFVLKEGQYIDCNPYAEKLLKRSREEILQLTVKQVVSSEYHDLSLKKVRELSETPYETAIVTKDREVIPVEAVGRNMEWNNQHVRVISVRDLTFQKEQERQILYHAHYDALTGLPNRTLCRDRINQAIKQAEQSTTQIAVMLVDIDDFKKINDTLSHDIGDRLIKVAADRLAQYTGEKCTVARHGGDEFVVVASDLHSISEIEPVVKTILSILCEPYHIDDTELVITASIGLSLFPDDALDYKTLLQNADIAMYKAKEEGKNTFHFYTHSPNNDAFRYLEIDRNLRQALKNNEFFLVYQPLFNADTLTLEGAETLLRWDNPELGMVSPAEFIPIAEQTGLIIDIGNWVLQQACTQAKQWVDKAGRNLKIAVNLSPRQIRNSAFLELIEACLQNTGLPPDALQLEVTEGLLVNQDSKTHDILERLNELGIRLSMDDFGTGYSSLSYLKNFPFQNLKIDRSFIQDITHDKDAQILVTATIAMAHGLGLTVTAEGIETQEQANFLQGKACDLLQGYHLGKPIPSKEFSNRFFSATTSI